MPRTRKQDMPSTVQRSDRTAQETYGATLDSAVEQYGDGRRAHQTAFASLKHTHEKVGDHWEPKDENGPSDAHAEGGRDDPHPTAGGVDANATKAHLLQVAKRLGVSGRSRMTKDELVEGIQRANDRATAKARGD